MWVRLWVESRSRSWLGAHVGNTRLLALPLLAGRLVRPLPQNPKPQRAVQPPKMRTTASWFFFGCSQPGQLRLTQSQKSTVLSSVSSVARLGLYGCALMSPLSSYSHHHYASNEGTGGAAGGTMFRMVRLDM